MDVPGYDRWLTTDQSAERDYAMQMLRDEAAQDVLTAQREDHVEFLEDLADSLGIEEPDFDDLVEQRMSDIKAYREGY